MKTIRFLSLSLSLVLQQLPLHFRQKKIAKKRNSNNDCEKEKETMSIEAAGKKKTSNTKN